MAKKAAVIVRKIKNDPGNRFKVIIRQEGRGPVDFNQNTEEQAKASASKAVTMLKKAGYSVKKQGF